MQGGSEHLAADNLWIFEEMNLINHFSDKNSMSLITCLSWVGKGFARKDPIQITGMPAEEEYDEPEDMEVEMDDELPAFSEMPEDEDFEDVKDEEGDEDARINPDDALIAVGVQNGDYSELHVYLYDEENSNLYVHHDFILGAYPLDCEWLPFNPLDTENSGNCLAVSSFDTGIEIWDLDLMNPVEPVTTLGGTKLSKAKKRRKPTKKLVSGSHTDSVLTLANHPTRNNLLASGSADCSVKIWDVFESSCKMTITTFYDKIQTVNWSPHDEKLLAVGGFDKEVALINADTPKLKQSFLTPGVIEKVQFSPYDPNVLSASTESGHLLFLDIRNMGTPLWQGQPHESQATLSFSPIKGLFATASMDKTVKLWNLNTFEALAEKDMKIDELFAAEFSRDSPFVLACGGSSGDLAVWDTSENEAVSNTFG